MMLNEELINDTDSVARIMSAMHEAYKVEKLPMDDEQSRNSIRIMMAKHGQINAMYDDFMNHWQFAAFFKRCEYAFNIKFEKRLLVWLGAMTCEFGIGGMILVAYYAQWRASVLRETHITFKNELEANDGLTLSMVCEKIFPFGIFQKETVRRFWDMQKVKAKPDNLIDYPKASLSFNPSSRIDPITPTILET